MDRRQLLKLFGATALGTSFAGCVPPFKNARAEEVHWGYIGEAGPDHWGELSTEFQTCQLGSQQAPIDLQNGIPIEVAPVKISYFNSPLTISNTGRTIQVKYAPGSSITVKGELFHLLQFHFHHPSEHYVSGQPFEMELHLVHRNDAGRLAIIGVFLKSGIPHAGLQPIWAAMPKRQTPEQPITGVTINAAQLLPTDQTSYGYQGSLTTPPCTEGVQWLVMRQPIEASPEQIQAFTDIFPLNARPLQPRHSRLIGQSR